MKTLDEVITELKTIYDRYEYEAEGCFYCSFLREYTGGYCYLADALHYLKEYQRYQNTPSRNGHMALVDYFEESQKNEPLTWDELKSMEGKPVWIEMDGYKPNWGIVMNQDKRNGRLMLCGYDEVEIRMEINEEGEGTGWQAYRKERE